MCLILNLSLATLLLVLESVSLLANSDFELSAVDSRNFRFILINLSISNAAVMGESLHQRSRKRVGAYTVQDKQHGHPDCDITE